MTQLTFGSYNLEEGGINHGSDARLHRQLEMLAAAEADVWALQECKHWAADYLSRLHFAEHMLGMRGFLARSGHHGCDVALFVRESSGIRITAQRHEEGPPYWHAVARVEAVIGGLPYSLASVHLAPSTPALRLIEAEALALIAKGRKAILGGDFNALPALDPNPDTAGIDPGHARRKLDRSAALAIEEAGLIDVGAHLGILDPTVGHASADRLTYRCDRVCTNLPEEAITGYRVIPEDEPKSDHRPVLATFTLPE